MDPGLYVLMDPIHLEESLIDEIMDSDIPAGQYIDIPGHRLFLFSTAYGCGCFPVDGPTDSECCDFENSECCDWVDSDTGILAMVPVDYIKQCDNGYTMWMTSSSDLTTAICLHETFIPTVVDGCFSVCNITIDTKSPRQKGYDHIIEVFNDGYQVSRMMTLYLMLNIQYNDLLEKDADEDKENI